MANQGLSSLPRSELQGMAKILGSNYRSRMGRTWIINATWTTNMLWKVIAAMLDPETTEKVHLTNKNTHPDLKEFFNPGQMLQKYGGTAPERDVPWPPYVPDCPCSKEATPLLNEDEYLEKLRSRPWLIPRPDLRQKLIAEKPDQTPDKDWRRKDKRECGYNHWEEPTPTPPSETMDTLQLPPGLEHPRASVGASTVYEDALEEHRMTMRTTKTQNLLAMPGQTEGVEEETVFGTPTNANGKRKVTFLKDVDAINQELKAVGMDDDAAAFRKNTHVSQKMEFPTTELEKGETLNPEQMGVPQGIRKDSQKSKKREPNMHAMSLVEGDQGQREARLSQISNVSRSRIEPEHKTCGNCVIF